MGNRYRNMIAGFAALGVLLAAILTSTPYHAQTQAQPYGTPRTKDGKPDLNGIWQAVNSANWDIEGHGASPGPFWQLGAEFSVPPGWAWLKVVLFLTSPRRFRKRRKTLPIG
jgi:hypothetical protein